MPFTKGNKLGTGRPKGAKNINKGFINQIALDLIGSFKSGTNYVYYHIDKETKEIVYIGKGKNNRAWSFSDYSRNEEWAEYKKENDIEVKIIACDLSEEEALAIEQALIKVNKPILNIVNNN